MANLATRTDRRRRRLERRMRRALRKEFAKYAEEAAERQPFFVSPTLLHEERLHAILAEFYPPSIKLGMTLAEEQLIKRARKQVVELEALTDRIISEWVNQRGLERAHTIAQTSRDAAVRALEASISEGLTQQQTANAIRGAVEGLSRGRATTIARTETHSAMMNASVEGAVELGADQKIWVPIEDDRVRITHSEADGQSVPMKDLFQIGVALLRFPGDPDAGVPEETINCRCVLQFG